MSWFEHGGSRISFEDEGQGAPVLFLPGWSEGIEEFRPLRDALAGRFRVVAADLPGSGKSGPQPREYAPTYYQDDARSFLALLDEVGISPAHIVGFSDGGEVALCMAVQDPAAVRTVVAWGAAGAIDFPADVLDAFSNVVDEPPEGFEEFSRHMKTTYGEAQARAMTQSAVTAWRAIISRGGDISRSAAASIAAPTLLITGENDVLNPPQLVSSTARAIPGGQFIEVKGAGHTLHETHGDWLAETIVDWLTREPTP